MKLKTLMALLCGMYLGGDRHEALKVAHDPEEFLEEMHVDQEAGHGREKVPRGPHLVQWGVREGSCSSRLLTWQRDAARAQHQRRVPPVPLTRRGKTARTPTARAASAAGAANMYTVSKAHDDSIAR